MLSSVFLLDGRWPSGLNWDIWPEPAEDDQREFLPGTERVKGLMPFDLTGHILASFLTMGNIFLHHSKVIDNIEESLVAGVKNSGIDAQLGLFCGWIRQRPDRFVRFRYLGFS